MAEYEVELFNVTEIQDIHTEAKQPVCDVNVNKPLYKRYHMAKVTETEYYTQQFVLFAVGFSYFDGPPKPPTLADLLAHLLFSGQLPQGKKQDVYRVTATGESLSVAEFGKRFAKQMLDF